MAIAFDAATDGGNNGGASASLTFSHTCTGSNGGLVVEVIGDTSTDDVTGVTYAGAAMSLVDKQLGIRWQYFYQLAAPATGANNVVVSASSSHFLLAGASSYTDVNASGQPDASTKQLSAGNAGTLTTSLTTVADNSWPILADVGFGGVDAPAASTGLTRRVKDTIFQTWGLFDKGSAKTPAGSHSMTTTRTDAGQVMGHIALSFAPTTSPPPPPSVVGPLTRGGALMHGTLIRGGRLVA